MEIWKDIIGYEGLYQVSNMGKVRNMVQRHGCYIKGLIVTTSRIRNLSCCKNPRGYPHCQLRKDGVAKNFTVHKLVAMHFLIKPNGEGRFEVNHKNGIKTDNSTENLEWVTHQENIRHAHRTGLIKTYKHGYKERQLK